MELRKQEKENKKKYGLVRKCLNNSGFNFELSDNNEMATQEKRDSLVKERRSVDKELQQMLDPEILPGHALEKYKCPNKVKINTLVRQMFDNI